MKIGLILNPLAKDKLTGIGYFSYYLYREIAKIAAEKGDSITVYTNKPLIHNPFKGIINYQHVMIPKIIEFKLFSMMGKTLFQKLFGDAPDIIVNSNELIGYYWGIPTLSTFHDIYVYRHSIKWPLVKLSNQFFASGIISVSEYTKKGILEKIPNLKSPIEVIHPAADSIFKPKTKHEVEKIKRRYRIDGNYFIVNCSFWWKRKNLINIIKAFSKFVKKFERLNFKLVITKATGGDPSYIKSVAYEIDKARLNSQVLDISAKFHDLPALYSGSIALVFPSFDEGFGIPIVEAMKSGCPVITSNISGTVEASGGAAILVRPYSVEDIFRAMTAVYTNSTLRKSLIKRGLKSSERFSWEKSAEKLYRFLSLIISGKAR